MRLLSPLLVIESFATMRKLLKRDLLLLGFDQILEADSKTKALKMLNLSADTSQKVSFIFCAEGVDDGQAFDLLRDLRGIPQYETTPFVTLSPHPAPALRSLPSANTKACEGWLTKPFSPASLQKTILTLAPELSIVERAS